MRVRGSPIGYSGNPQGAHNGPTDRSRLPPCGREGQLPMINHLEAMNHQPTPANSPSARKTATTMFHNASPKTGAASWLAEQFHQIETALRPQDAAQAPAIRPS